MEELFVYSLKYKHILILDEKLFKAMTVMHYGCVYCYFSVGLQFTQKSRLFESLNYQKKGRLVCLRKLQKESNGHLGKEAEVGRWADSHFSSDTTSSMGATVPILNPHCSC